MQMVWVVTEEVEFAGIEFAGSDLESGCLWVC